ncbi:MAG: sensor histidine kinase [bacterium]|nr:sensor histidine kinase [bacterium]
MFFKTLLGGLLLALIGLAPIGAIAETKGIAVPFRYLIDVQGRYSDFNPPPPEAFSAAPVEQKGFGLSQSDLWLSFQLDPPGPGSWTLWQSYWYLNEVRLYAYSQGDTRFLGLGGSTVAPAQRAHQSSQILFPLERPEGTFLMMVKGGQLLDVRLVLLDAAGLRNLERRQSLTGGLLLGAYSLVVFFNLLLWGQLRQKTYVYHALAVVSLALGLLLHQGLGREFLPSVSGQVQHWIAASNFILFAALLSAFGRNLLKTWEAAPWLDRWLRLFYWGPLGWLLVGGLSFVSYSALAMALLGASASTQLVASWILARRGSPMARIYLGGWSLLLGFMLLRIAAAFGWISNLGGINEGMYLGGLAGAVFSAVVLAAQLRLHRQSALDSQREITELTLEQARRLEQQVQERTAQLDQALKDKDQFLRVIAHDLRGPIHSTKVWLDLLERGELVPDSQTWTLLSQGAQASYDLLESLLQWALSQSDSFQPCPEEIEPQGLCTELERLFSGGAQAKGIRLEFDCAPGLSLYGDKKMLLTCLRNLVGNALKYTKPGGCVSVKPREQAERALLEVRDTGVGMSAQQLETLFDLTRQARSTPGTAQEPGSGMGLLIVRQMAWANGGELEVQSHQGQGTVCRLTWPARPAGAQQPES